MPEATNAEDEFFSDERLAGSLRGTRNLVTFTAGAPQSDDITMLSIRIPEPVESVVETH